MTTNPTIPVAHYNVRPLDMLPTNPKLGVS